MTTSFSPLDLLDMGETEQDILRCLNQNPGLSIPEIAKSIKIPPDELEPIIQRMLDQSQIVEQVKGKERVYMVQFGTAPQSPTKTSTNLLDQLLEE